MLKNFLLSLLIIFIFNNCSKVYTGYKFDKFSLDDIKLFSSKEDIIAKMGNPTMNINHEFSLKLDIKDKNKKDKDLQMEKIFECQTHNCLYYLGIKANDITFIRNAFPTYQTLVLKFNKDNQLIEKYYLED